MLIVLFFLISQAVISRGRFLSIGKKDNVHCRAHHGVESSAGSKIDQAKKGNNCGYAELCVKRRLQSSVHLGPTTRSVSDEKHDRK